MTTDTQTALLIGSLNYTKREQNGTHTLMKTLFSVSILYNMLLMEEVIWINSQSAADRGGERIKNKRSGNKEGQSSSLRWNKGNVKRKKRKVYKKITIYLNSRSFSLFKYLALSLSRSAQSF